MEPPTDHLAARLLHCPVGCAFLLTIERDRVPVGLAVTPPQAFARAAAALRALDPWMPEHRQTVTNVLLRGSRFASLAREVVAHPGSGWWTDPMDRARQLLVVDDTPDRAASGSASTEPNPRWEAYAQRPVGWRMTSTLRGQQSCLDAVIASGVGDWPISEYHRFEARIDESVRVREISGPADWHDLCVSYPRVNQDPASPAGAGTLAPDWGRVASQWDGVHLTFMALLTAPFVRHNSVAGSTMLWSWDSEGTIWLPGEFVGAGAPLAALEDGDRRRFEEVAPLMLRAPGIPDGVRRRGRSSGGPTSDVHADE